MTTPGIATISSGSTFTARARPKNPVTQQLITDASVTANFYNPSKSPVTNLTDRGSPDYSLPLVFDSTSRFYLAQVTATGWAAGLWTMQAVAEGGASGINTWEWSTFEVVT